MTGRSLNESHKLMKTRLHCSISRRCSGSGPPAAITALLLAALPLTAADTSFTGDGWINGVPVPGVFTTDSLGQVTLRGNVHTIAFQGSDPRVAGLDLVIMDMSYNADGTANIQGPAYLQVGTWDAAMTNFTPSGGVWVFNYSGLGQTNGSVQINAAGYGVGGTIDGQRIAVTVSRGPVPNPLTNPFDPTVPFHRTGTIKPPLLSTNLVLDDFSGPAVGWNYYGPQSRSYTRSNGQLVVNGYWPGVITTALVDSYTFGGGSPQWSAADGQTLETRVDLVSLNASATAAFFVLGNSDGLYAVCKGHDFMWVHKWSPSLPWGPITLFSYEKVQVPDTNVVLALALTKTDANVVVTARVLDKSNPSTVLYEHSVVDTPDADPALTSEEFLNLSGMNLALSPDLPGAPFTTGGAALGVFQYNPDGQLPAAIATFDNLELRKSEVPPLGIARAVRLSWPASATINYAVEGAPTVQGPWLPVNELQLPGIQQVTVPASPPAQFFRLRQAP